MISINVTPTGTQPSEGSVSSAVVNDKIDKKIESFKTETFDAPLVTAPVGDEVIPVKRPDESFGTIQINQLGSGTSTGSLIEATYDELVSWADSGKLIPGQLYRMIDYTTSYYNSIISITDDTPSYIQIESAQHPFDLILQAKTSSDFYTEVSAAHSSRDTEGYFKNSDLAKWRLWYDLDASKYPGTISSENCLAVNMEGVVTLICSYKNFDGTYYIWEGQANLFDMQVTLVCKTLDSDLSKCETVIVTVESDGESVDSGEQPIDGSWISRINLPISTGWIYRMVDEFNNDCTYDFKNIVHNKDNQTLYTFTIIDDYQIGLFTNSNLSLDYSLRNYNHKHTHCSNNKILSQTPQANLFVVYARELGETRSGDQYGFTDVSYNYVDSHSFCNVFEGASGCSIKQSYWVFGKELLNVLITNSFQTQLLNYASNSLLYDVENSKLSSLENSEITNSNDLMGIVQDSKLCNVDSFIGSIFNSNVYATRAIDKITLRSCTVSDVYNIKNNYSTYVEITHSELESVSNININNTNYIHYLTCKGAQNLNINTISEKPDLRALYKYNITGQASEWVDLNIDMASDINSSLYITYIRFDKDNNIYSYTDLDIYNKLNS